MQYACYVYNYSLLVSVVKIRKCVYTTKWYRHIYEFLVTLSVERLEIHVPTTDSGSE